MAISGSFKRKARKASANIATIQFNTLATTPETFVTGDINQGAIAEILAKMRRCMGKYTGDGEMTICYLRNDNSNYYHDGSASVLTGEQGDVFVYLPEFWYKIVTGLNSTQISFAHTQVDSAWRKSPAGLVGAFVMGQFVYTDSDGTTRTAQCGSSAVAVGALYNGGSHASMDLMFVRAAERGAGYRPTDYEMHSAIVYLFYAKYGTCDAEPIFGKGIEGLSVGLTAGYGNADVAADRENNMPSSFCGIEGVNSSRMEALSGISATTYGITIDCADGGQRTIPLPAVGSGYLLNLQGIAFGNYLDAMPTGFIDSSEVDDTGLFNDSYSVQTDPTDGVYTLIYRGGQYSPYPGGLAAMVISSSASTGAGGRLCFRGNIIEQPNVAAFKAITITNPYI